MFGVRQARVEKRIEPVERQQRPQGRRRPRHRQLRTERGLSQRQLRVGEVVRHILADMLARGDGYLVNTASAAGLLASMGSCFDTASVAEIDPSGPERRPEAMDVTWDPCPSASPGVAVAGDAGAVTLPQGGGGLNEAALPLDPAKNCTPVYPHQFLRVNTIFEVVKAAGGLTAWSDKHPAYELVNGPSGKGVDDLFVAPGIGGGPSGEGRPCPGANCRRRLQSVQRRFASPRPEL